MKKISINFLFFLVLTISMYAQPPVDHQLGNISGTYKYTLERTVNNTAFTYCIGFTLSKELKINLNPNGANLTFVSVYKLPGATSYPNMKFNSEVKLPVGEYRFYFVNNSSVAFKLEMVFTSLDEVPIITPVPPNENPQNIAATGINYIRTIIPLIEKSTIAYNTSQEMISVDYYDGLGRPVEKVQRGISPTGKDLVSLQEYDEFGRESNTWLPIAIQTNNGAFADLAKVKSNTGAIYPSESAPYTKTIFDNSPLNRTLEQYGPGADWQNTNKKAIRTGYLTNKDKTGTITIADSLVCGLYISSDDKKTISISKSKNYASGELYVTRLKDEDNNVSYEFKDKLGQVVLTRQIVGGALHDTYYIYDSFGNLRVVLPPILSDMMTGNSSWTDTNTDFGRYAYLYKYDERNRCIAKKIPGADWIYYVYDKADQMIFSQDGEQRKKNEWTFIIPDGFGRAVLSGTCKNALTFTANPLGSVVVKADWAKATNVNKGYTIKGVTLTTPVIQAVNYFDSYEFMGLNGIPAITDANFKPEAIAGYGTQYTGGYKGLLTGTMSALLDGSATPTYIYTAMYFDNRGRVVQTKSTNHLAGGIEKEYIAYNFIGQPTQKQHIHSATGKNTVTEIYAYTYDHAGRLLTTTHQWNGKTAVTLTQNTYDELGRLNKNVKNNQANLTTSYTYNVRSWTKSITSPLFKQTLYYNESYGGSAKQYNGNISAMDWWIAADKTRGYAFTYDNLSRLTAANYLENATANTNYKTAYTYDKQGNIKTLQRYGKTTTGSTFGLIDNLTITHTGNQLLKVDETIATITMSESTDFKNYITAATEYYYNSNGAMYKDLNKGVTDIQYNSLNLPRIVDIKSPVAEARNEYTYTAAGTKLKVVQKWNPNYSTAPVIGSAINTASLTSTKTTDYVGNMIYENGSLKRILVEGGYIESSTYHFYLTDHLGNNRIVANASGAVIQRNHYYPFGMTFAETPIAEQGKQQYKYNGKEFDQMHGLNLYDYSARYMDAALPRFTTIDPRTEKYYSISPYAYVGNNPINSIDLKGDSVTFTAENKNLLKQTTTLINEGVGSKVAKIGKDGILSVKNLNDKQLSKLTNEQKEFYNIIKDVSNSEGMATIGVVSGSEDVLIGSWNLEKIDIADMNAIGEGLGMNKYSTFIHEIVEQNYKQTNEPSSYSVGHFIKAIPAEQKVSGYSRGLEYSGSNGVVIFPYTKVGSGTINVHLKLNKGHITNIERKK